MNTDRFLCRAKHIQSGKWVEGAYYKHLPYTPGCGVIAPEKDYKHLIIRDGVSDWSMPRGLDCYEIDPETLGQCTELRDRKYRLIFQGDIIRFYWTEQDPQDFVVRWNMVRNGFDFRVFKNGKIGCKFDRWWTCFASGQCDYAEIIGNIHEMEVE